MAGVHLCYYLWQLIHLARRVHREVGFDLAHHVTFGKYWAPNLSAFLEGVPSVWGPVEGGESAPISFEPNLGPRGLVYEFARGLARALGELDPLERRTARLAIVALFTTPKTAARPKPLAAQWLELSQVALPGEEPSALARLPSPGEGDALYDHRASA